MPYTFPQNVPGGHLSVMTQDMPTYKGEHVTVTEPIAVLSNCSSVSMAEHTASGAQLLENGAVIGTRTWGGYSALSGAETYTNNYAAWNNGAGPDNQLDRALQWIRNGN